MGKARDTIKHGYAIKLNNGRLYNDGANDVTPYLSRTKRDAEFERSLFADNSGMQVVKVRIVIEEV